MRKERTSALNSKSKLTHHFHNLHLTKLTPTITTLLRIQHTHTDSSHLIEGLMFAINALICITNHHVYVCVCVLHQKHDDDDDNFFRFALLRKRFVYSSWKNKTHYVCVVFVSYIGFAMQKCTFFVSVCVHWWLFWLKNVNLLIKTNLITSIVYTGVYIRARRINTKACYLHNINVCIYKIKNATVGV